MRASALVLLIAVAVVLADSSIVTLALPSVAREFGSGVAEVAWVLISFNVVLAVSSLPAMTLVRRVGATRAWRLGVVVFAAASLAAALSTGLGLLVGARCMQALGGAIIVAAAFERLVVDVGRTRAGGLWVGAGILGAAVGPAIGGALTEILSWHAIFAVQVPLAALAASPGGARRRAPAFERGRPSQLILAALALISAALTAALFLLVVMLIEGWRLSPIAAAGVVTIIPAAALLSRPLARRLGGATGRAAAGAVALAGGLAALGLLPGADVGWIVAPAILIGFGLGQSLAGLSESALESVDDVVGAGAWTITARHAGVVLGLALLTPVFTTDLRAEDVAAQRAGSAMLLDANLAPQVKIVLGERIVQQIDHADGRLPDLSPAFVGVGVAPDGRIALAQLQAGLSDEVARAATQAFSRAFLAAALLALLALVPLVALGKGRRR